MATKEQPDLLCGFEEIGAYLGMTERQFEHLRALEPSIPTFKLGRKVCALRTRMKAWLEQKADEGEAD